MCNIVCVHEWGNHAVRQMPRGPVVTPLAQSASQLHRYARRHRTLRQPRERWTARSPAAMPRSTVCLQRSAMPASHVASPLTHVCRAPCARAFFPFGGSGRIFMVTGARLNTLERICPPSFSSSPRSAQELLFKLRLDSTRGTSVVASLQSCAMHLLVASAICCHVMRDTLPEAGLLFCILRFASRTEHCTAFFAQACV